jgi:hypothetical protein
VICATHQNLTGWSNGHAAAQPRAVASQRYITRLCRFVPLTVDVSHLHIHACMRYFAFLLLLLTGLLVGCQEKTSPIVSGAVLDGGIFLGQYTVERPGQQPKTWALTQKQLEQISLWLHERESGWRMILASPLPPSFSIVLKHADGSRTQMDLFSVNENWQHVIIMKNTDSGKNGIRNISTQERDSLLQLVKEMPDD